MHRGDAKVIAALAAAAVLLAAFAVIETRSADPLLPIRVLRSRDRSGAYLIAPVGAACVAPPSARSLECGQALVLVPWPLALRTLVTRYPPAYGPATSQHFARWLAIPPRSAAGLFGRLADALKRVEWHGQPGWTLAGDTATLFGPHRGIRLLPYFDAYVVAGQPRERRTPARPPTARSPRRARPGTTRSCSSTERSAGGSRLTPLCPTRRCTICRMPGQLCAA